MDAATGIDGVVYVVRVDGDFGGRVVWELLKGWRRSDLLSLRRGSHM